MADQRSVSLSAHELGLLNAGLLDWSRDCGEALYDEVIALRDRIKATSAEPPLTDERLVELSQLDEVATPGPWRVHRCSCAEPGTACSIRSPADSDEPGYQGVVYDSNESECGHTMDIADASLIAAGRNALPELVDEVRVLRRARDELVQNAMADQVALADLRAEVAQLKRAREDSRAAIYSLLGEVGGLQRQVRRLLGEPTQLDVMLDGMRPEVKP